MSRTSIIIDLLVNSRDAAGELDRTARGFTSFGSTMEGLAAPAGVALGAIGGLALGAAKAASDLEQTTGAVDKTFGASAASIHEWAKTSANDLGMAATEYNQLATGIGGSMIGMGVATDTAAKATHDLMLRAADLASVQGGTAAQASEAVQAAFRGEYDSLQRLVPSINAAAVEQQMAAEASAGMTYASEEAAKAAAITNIIMDKSAQYAGNFAAESDTAAGAQQRAQAQFQNTAAALGEQLLPAITTVMGWLTQFGMWISEHVPLVTTLALVIGGLAAAVLLINGAMAVYAAAQTVAAIATAAWSAAAGIGAVATTAFGVAMAILTSPITLVILAIGAVIAIVVLLVKNWDTVAEAAGKAWSFIKEAAGNALDWIKSTAASVLDWLKGVWSGLGDFISGVWDKIKQAAAVAWEVIKTAALGPIYALMAILEAFGVDTTQIFEKIKQVGSAIWNVIKSAATTALNMIMAPIKAIGSAITTVINSIKSAISWASSLAAKIPFIGGLFSAPAAPVAYTSGASSLMGVAPRLSARSGAGSRSGGGITINVTGALDPVGVARQIKALLVAQDRREGSTAT